MIALVLEDHPDRAATRFGRDPVRHPARDGSILSIGGASDEPGVVHFPKVAVVGLQTAGTSIQAALNAAGLGGLGVTARGVLALPLFAFSDVQIERVWEKLPVI